MAEQHEHQSSRAEQWADRRLNKLGNESLRPRNAAYLIAVIWLVAVVVFGIIERIADPDRRSRASGSRSGGRFRP